ncbi:ScbR family autoregulator-binding transcription factor [uncultured Streptomyces sp.]|uniref:ScbR family autoregulator-binding transcription factor n=1 Tax=uncultured Streptomyces sp. TaxID=174707 RepID=UPI002620BC97|nr:ScbR family autoregulator-binding transcription factor [uncultured Streptomyces sp.]
MAQQERAARTYRALLEAAAEVFARRGYAAATISEIMSVAGVTKGALYFHFSGKEALAHAVLRQAVALKPEHRLTMQAMVDLGLVLAYRLPREPLLRGAARLAADQSARPFFGGPWPQWRDTIAALLSEGRRRGEVFEHVDPVETAHVLVGAFTGLQLVSTAGGDPGGLLVLTSDLYRLVLPGIAVPGVLGVVRTEPERARRVFETLGRPTWAVAHAGNAKTGNAAVGNVEAGLAAADAPALSG